MGALLRACLMIKSLLAGLSPVSWQIQTAIAKRPPTAEPSFPPKDADMPKEGEDQEEKVGDKRKQLDPEEEKAAKEAAAGKAAEEEKAPADE